MFEALLVEDTVTLSVDIRMLCAAFTIIGCDIVIPFPTKISSPFLIQLITEATPVQLNSATELSEVLTDRGGIVTTERKRIYN